MDQDRFNQPTDGSVEPRTSAEALRAFADGEFGTPPPEVEQTDERVRFERSLRESVGRVMGPVGAPAGLRERLVAAMAAEHDASADGFDHSHEDAPAAVESPLGDTRSRSFWTGIRGISAIAATLLIAGTVVVLGFRSAATVDHDMLAGVVSIATGEHERCSVDDQAFSRKMHVQTWDEAVAEFRQLFGRQPSFAIDALPAAVAERGYAFAGLGRCGIPGDGPSAHLVYVPLHDDSLPKLSLFIQRDDGKDCLPGFESGDCVMVTGGLCPVQGTYQTAGHCNDPTRSKILIWKDSGFIYYLVAPNEEKLRHTGEAFGAPMTTAVEV
ncbi:MAG: hypothetical protein AAGI30_10255 [Planctomycetota bacterium]